MQNYGPIDAIRAPGESLRRLEACVEQICQLGAPYGKGTQERLERLRELHQDCVQEMIRFGRGHAAPRWYRQMFYLNLPESDIGHAVLTVENNRIHLETGAYHPISLPAAACHSD